MLFSFYFSAFVLAKTYASVVPEIISRSYCNGACISQKLGPRLSSGASIVHDVSAIPRWSEFDAPNPGTVVNVATEKDVLITVQFCNQNGLSFLAQSGGNGWATTFQIGQKDVVINLRGIKQIVFNKAKDVVTLQGGALISEVVAAAYANNTRVLTGNCDCVGALGAVLGGGYGRLMGLYGFGVDNLLSANLITPSGSAITVDSNNVDLWWAIRGAGPNFGIVTSARMKAYPIAKAENTAWLGPLVFTQDKIEELVRAINDLKLTPPMAIFMYYIVLGAEPGVIAFPFYVGNEKDGRMAFASIFAVGPVSDGTAVVPYDEWNAGSETFCVRGSRKPSYGAGIAQMDPTTWRAIWNEYTAFVAAHPDARNNTVVLLEAYSLGKAQTLPDSSASFPLRSNVKFNAVVIPWYTDPKLDIKAEEFGSAVRGLWRSTSDLKANLTYINFAYGDEALPTVYGDSVMRLQSIKKQYDPFGRFDQWFPLSHRP